LVIGPASDEALHFAASLLLRYAKRVAGDGCRVSVQLADHTRLFDARPQVEAERAATVATR
jgi:hypothetical protein